jgi:putative transposase
VFLEEAHFQHFIDLLEDGVGRFAVDVYGYNAMPNHFHVIVSQRELGAISAYFHRVSGLSASNFRWATSSVGLGHVFQRRFWSHAITDERHFLTALKYVEANALRACLVERAEHWKWGSLWERLNQSRRIVSPPPVALPMDWCHIVNRPLPPEMLESLRSPSRRGRPTSRQNGLLPAESQSSASGSGEVLPRLV